MSVSRRRVHPPRGDPAGRRPEAAAPPAHHRRRPDHHHLDRRRPGRSAGTVGPQRARAGRVPHERRRGWGRPQPEGHQRDGQALVDTEFPPGDQTFPDGTVLPAGGLQVKGNTDLWLPGKAIPVFRKTCRCRRQKIVKARMYAAAQGVYELRLNGRRSATRSSRPAGPTTGCGSSPRRTTSRSCSNRHQQHRCGAGQRLVRRQPRDVRPEQVRDGDLCSPPNSG